MPQLVNKEVVKHILDTTDTFLFDCDGVLWTSDGPIDGSAEVIVKLKRLNDIMCTAYAAAQYLLHIGFKNKVYLIGHETSVGAELRNVGIPYIGPGPDHLEGTLKDWLQIELDPEVKCVLIATDYDISYMKILKASSYLCDPECLYIATNEDRRLPSKGKRVCIPDTACMVTPVTLASNRNPIVLGKPETHMFELLKKANNLNPLRTLMTGDSLNTDILLAKNCGIRSMVVLSGITTEDELTTTNSKQSEADLKRLPDFYTPKLSEFGQFL